MTYEDEKILKSHSLMLGQIGCEVEEFCEEDTTTLDGVRLMRAELLELRGYKLRREVEDKYEL